MCLCELQHVAFDEEAVPAQGVGDIEPRKRPTPKCAHSWNGCQAAFKIPILLAMPFKVEQLIKESAMACAKGFGYGSAICVHNFLLTVSSCELNVLLARHATYPLLPTPSPVEPREVRG